MLADSCKPLKGLDGFLEHPLAALRIGLGGPEVGQGSDHLDSVMSQKFGQIGLRRQQQDGQVAAVHHVPAKGP